MDSLSQLVIPDIGQHGLKAAAVPGRTAMTG